MENFTKCKVEGCENNIWARTIKKGYCRRHYQQMYIYGKILKRNRFDPNEIIDCGDYYEICLYGFAKKGKEPKEIARTKIDKEDLEKIKDYKWCLTTNGYVHSMSNNKHIFLHSLIMGNPPIGYEIDHRYGDTLDNRKSKLRFVTHSQNEMNKKSIGITWDKKNNKWRALIKINGKTINLGRFIKKQDAIKTRKEAELKYFGEFAYKGN